MTRQLTQVAWDARRAEAKATAKAAAEETQGTPETPAVSGGDQGNAPADPLADTPPQGEPLEGYSAILGSSTQEQE